MLGNDVAGDCVEAAILHCIMQQDAYLTPGAGLVATDDEALGFYSALTGYDPNNPNSDNGSMVMGPQGAMQYWCSHGVTAGGKLNKASVYLATDAHNPVQIQQAVDIFGSALVGIDFPIQLLSQPIVPFIWDDVSGPREGHEVLVVGYDTIGTLVMYDLVSWGQMFRIPEPALLQIIEEAVAVYDRASLDARGVNAAGVPEATLLADMAALRALG